MTDKPIVEDFAAIAEALRGLEGRPQPPPSAGKPHLWCNDCRRGLVDAEVGYRPDWRAYVHTERSYQGWQGCGCIVHPHCETCNNVGWMQYKSVHIVGYYECRDCHNPFMRSRP